MLSRNREAPERTFEDIRKSLSMLCCERQVRHWVCQSDATFKSHVHASEISCVLDKESSNVLARMLLHQFGDVKNIQQ